MKIMLLAIVIVIISIASLGYYKLIYRIIKKDEVSKKVKILTLIISMILAVSSVNLFSVYGLFLLHFLVFTYILELLYILLKKITKKNFLKLEKIRNFCIIPIIFTSIYFVYGYYNINNAIEVKYTVETKKDISQDYRVVLITDLHYCSKLDKEKIKDTIKKISDLKPDIVVLGGDIIDESTTNSEMNEIFEVLGNINSNLGTYYVYGNHDRQMYTKSKTYTVDELNNAITKNGIIILCDESQIINEDIIIYGREDISSERKDLSEYVNLEENNKKFAIMIDHQPLEYDINKENSIDLILSGHTHAGQIFPAQYFIDIFKTSDLSYGYKKYGNLNAIVSSGMFGWGYPIRTSKHSEYVVIDIVKNN